LIKALYEIGKIHEKNYDETQQFTEDLGAKYTATITINVETKNGSLIYTGCSMEKKKDVNYLYRKTPSARFDPYSLTLKPAKHGPERIIDRFIKYCEVHKGKLISGIEKVLKENREVIIRDIEVAAKNCDKNERYFVTVVISGRYVGEIEEFRKIFLGEVQKLPKSRAGTCFICGKETEVGAKVSDILKFATIDQPGFAYRMNKKSHDITMPLCSECFAKLALGKKIADEKLTLNFYGSCDSYDSRVYVLPRFFGERIEKHHRFAQNTLAAFDSLTNTFKEENGRYEKFERKIVAKLGKEETYSTLNFVFFMKARKKDEVKLYLNIQDVPPSRLKMINFAATSIENELKSLGSPYIKFETLWKVFKGYSQLQKKATDKNPVPPSDFLKCMQAIFKGFRINLDPYKKAALRYIHSFKMNADEKERKNLFFERGNIVAMGYFLDRLNNLHEGGRLDLSKSKSEILKDFFELYPDFFKNDELKLTFIIGMIHSIFVDIQESQGYTGTADQRIKGYRMKPDDFKEHLSYMKSKFKYYLTKIKDASHVEFMKRLFEIAGEYQLKAGMKWKSSITDLNYAFLCGEASKRLLMSSNENKKEIEDKEV